MLESIQGKLLAILLPIILGPIIAGVVQWSKRISPWLDSRHALIKQAYVALWAAALPAIAATLKLASVCADGTQTCDVWNLDWKLVISTFAMALVTHGLRKKKER